MGSLDAGLDLLDREIVDNEGTVVGQVDDVELSDPSAGPPEIAALLLAPAAYGRRLGGVSASGSPTAAQSLPRHLNQFESRWIWSPNSVSRSG